MMRILKELHWPSIVVTWLLGMVSTAVLVIANAADWVVLAVFGAIAAYLCAGQWRHAWKSMKRS